MSEDSWPSSKQSPGGSVVKNPPANARDGGSIPGLGRSPGEGNGKLLQYSCPGNPMDRGAWWATVPGVAESDMIEHASTNSSLCFWQGAGSDSTPRKRRNLGQYSEVPCPVCTVTALRSQGRLQMLCRW